MSTEMSKEMIEEYCGENAQKGKIIPAAREGTHFGWRSFKLTPEEITQFNKNAPDWIHAAFLTSRITGIMPKEIHAIRFEDELVTVIPFKKGE